MKHIPGMSGPSSYHRLIDDHIDSIIRPEPSGAFTLALMVEYKLNPILPDANLSVEDQSFYKQLCRIRHLITYRLWPSMRTEGKVSSHSFFNRYRE
jgi:hypothetical protein